jgi:uncharacterized protein (DUF983 family)
MAEQVATRLGAILRQRCPRCRRGRVFRGAVAMNEVCPACGLRFEREPGYFLGAMYFSYGLATGLVALVYLLTTLLFPGWPIWGAPAVAVAVLVPFVPVLFRYSRVLWLHFDHWAWPG